MKVTKSVWIPVADGSKAEIEFALERTPKVPTSAYVVDVDYGSTMYDARSVAGNRFDVQMKFEWKEDE